MVLNAGMTDDHTYFLFGRVEAPIPLMFETDPSSQGLFGVTCILQGVKNGEAQRQHPMCRVCVVKNWNATLFCSTLLYSVLYYCTLINSSILFYTRTCRTLTFVNIHRPLQFHQPLSLSILLVLHLIDINQNVQYKS